MHTHAHKTLPPEVPQSRCQILVNNSLPHFTTTIRIRHLEFRLITNFPNNFETLEFERQVIIGNLIVLSKQKTMPILRHYLSLTFKTLSQFSLIIIPGLISGIWPPIQQSPFAKYYLFCSVRMWNNTPLLSGL